MYAGARDGALMLWDSREPARWDNDSGLALSSPALAIHDAHRLSDSAAESARKRRKSVSVGKSVVLCFYPIYTEYWLSNNSVIKL